MTDESSLAEAPALVEADSIVKRFGGAIAVNDVSVSVRGGEIHGLVGENGAGKSTLMRILAGVLTPDEGEVRVEGQPLHRRSRAALDAGIALVHQELSLVPEMTGRREHHARRLPLAAAASSSGQGAAGARRGRAAEIGVSVDLDEPVARLSVALRQFVEIARAVARKPQGAHPRRADRVADAGGDRLPAGDAPAAGRAGPGDRLHLPPAPRDLRASATGSPCCATAAWIDTMRHRRDTTPDDLVDKMVGRELKRDLEVHREASTGRRGAVRPRASARRRCRRRRPRRPGRRDRRARRPGRRRSHRARPGHPGRRPPAVPAR